MIGTYVFHPKTIPQALFRGFDSPYTCSNDLVPLYILNYHTKLLLCLWTMVFLMYFSNFQKPTHSLGAMSKNHGNTMVIFDELMTLNTKTLLF